MTDPHSICRGDDVHALSGAYAVDALDDIERARFEGHLAQCADCRAEVESFHETAALLAVDDTAPPAALRGRVLSGISAIRPLPPLTTTADDDLAARRQRRLSLSRLPLLVAAAAVLIAAVGGALWLRPDSTPPETQLTAAEQVLAAADAVTVAKRFPDGARASVVVSRSVGHAVILTEDMAPAPKGRDYQLWLQTPAGELQPAGLMPDLREATVLLEGNATRATGVGITIEPDGGSKQPSTTPIAFFSLDG